MNMKYVDSWDGGVNLKSDEYAVFYLVGGQQVLVADLNISGGMCNCCYGLKQVI